MEMIQIKNQSDNCNGNTANGGKNLKKGPGGKVSNNNNNLDKKGCNC